MPMIEVVTQLRSYQHANNIRKEIRLMTGRAADEIERLRAALQELLDDPLSDIRADMRAGMKRLLAGIDQQSAPEKEKKP